jgi:hypothetical protein
MVEEMVESMPRVQLETFCHNELVEEFCISLHASRTPDSAPRVGHW